MVDGSNQGERRAPNGDESDRSQPGQMPPPSQPQVNDPRIDSRPAPSSPLDSQPPGRPVGNQQSPRPGPRPTRPASPPPPPTGSRPKPSPPATPSATPEVDRLHRGAYDKGAAWKWGARLAGGSLGWLMLATLLGAFGSGLAIFIFGAVFFMPLTAKAGLANEPNMLAPASPPMFGGLWGMGYRFQDTVGDWMMTPIWNLIRQNTDTRLG